MCIIGRTQRAACLSFSKQCGVYARLKMGSNVLRHFIEICFIELQCLSFVCVMCSLLKVIKNRLVFAQKVYAIKYFRKFELFSTYK